MHSVSQLGGDGLIALNSYPPTSPTSSPTNQQATLSHDQCQQLISYLQSQMQTQAHKSELALSHSSIGSSNFPTFSGMFSLTPLVASVNKSNSLWLLDTGVIMFVALHHSLVILFLLKMLSLPFQTLTKFPFSPLVQLL